MKCPKCSYLGFETGDRCKNCGYDFSLISTDDSYGDESGREPLPDFDIRADLRSFDSDAPSEWLDDIDDGLSRPTVVEPVVARPTDVQPVPVPRMMLAEEPSSPLPLFTPEDDQPLVRVPAVPRPPLSVRRTPDSPVQRVVAKQIRRQTPDRDHVLLFGEEHDAVAEEPDEPDAALPLPHVATVFDELRPSGVQPRMIAALIDHAILLTIDLVVVYFTLRMAALTPSDWAQLPPVPMLAFLVFVKLAYFSAFTSVGGQTIGKMAAGIRVVADDASGLDISRAMQRAAAVLISLVTLGIGFLPALFTSDRRALHDRIAHTRVISVPSA